MRWDGPDGYFVSDDRSLVDVERVHRWLADESYWATGRPLDVRGVRQQLLATRDAHGLYRKFGFVDVAPGRFLEKRL